MNTLQLLLLKNDYIFFKFAPIVVMRLTSEEKMINGNSLNNEELYDLMQEYRIKFGKLPITFEMPTGTTKLPNSTTEEELIEALKKCLMENVKLSTIYPSLDD